MCYFWGYTYIVAITRWHHGDMPQSMPHSAVFSHGSIKVLGFNSFKIWFLSEQIGHFDTADPSGGCT